MKIALVAGVLVMLAACGSGNTNNHENSGASGGSSGTSGTGGSAGSGGTPGSGGASNTGGISSTGGTSGCDYTYLAGGRNFVTGSIILYAGKFYIAKHDNPGYDPIISPYFWAPYAGCSDVVFAPPAEPAPSSIAMNCTDGAVLSGGSYLVENNQWGKDGVNGEFSQCVGIGPIAGDGSMSARWTWSWPKGPNEVKGYPAIIYGQKPGKGSTSNSGLPKRLDVLTSAASSWSARSSYTGRGQLTYDLWLTSDAQQRASFLDTPITHEIMIVVESYGGYGLTRNPAWYVGDAEIDGVRYATYKAENFGIKGWRFLVFQALRPMVDGSLELKSILTHLKNKGYVTGTEYLASIEFGTEPEEGTGDVYVKSFKATIK